MAKNVNEIRWIDWVLLAVCVVTLLSVVAPRYRGVPHRPMPMQQEIKTEHMPEGGKPNGPRGQGQRGQGPKNGGLLTP